MIFLKPKGFLIHMIQNGLKVGSSSQGTKKPLQQQNEIRSGRSLLLVWCFRKLNARGTEVRRMVCPYPAA